MNVELLEPHGLCAGVNAAIAKALTLSDVYCLHPLVHNEIVLGELKALGYRFVARLRDVPDGATVVFSAHGVSPSVRAEAARRHLKVVDTTCPFVAKVHRAARAFAERGLPVLILGEEGHAETDGIAGEVTDAGGDVRVVRPADAAHFRPPRAWADRFAVVVQTTMDAEAAERAIETLSSRYDVVSSGAVCTATSERQRAVRAFTGDALVVLGSRTSSNAKRLVEAAPCPAFLAADLDELLRLRSALAPYPRVGITAAASTPERFVASAVDALRHVPEHVAIIMDGNGRWAKARGKARGEGHAAGAKTLMKVMDWCGARGIRYVSVYAFSTENWKRPAEEVSGIMRLFGAMLARQAATFVRNRVRFRMIGRRGDLDPKLLEAVERLERKTSAFERQLIVCVSYGGRAEIVDAANRAIAAGEQVTEETFAKYLYAPDVPDPDLVIRTSGERRTSNFLLWESAYAEYHFTDVLWPDFSEKDLDAALADYAARDRRRGDVA